MSAAALAILAATIPYLTASYSAICTAEQSTGFNWQAGNWSRANFKPNTYIVVRGGDGGPFCMNVEKPTDSSYEGGEFHTRSVCMNIREFGEKVEKVPSQMCTEYYTKQGNADWEVEVGCDHWSTKFSFKLDGPFIRSYVPADLQDRPKDDYKDSLAISVGKCARIAN